MLSHLPTDMLNNFHDLARLEFSNLDQQLHRDIGSIESECSAKGLAISGVAVSRICEAGAGSLAIRCRIGYQLLFNTMNAYGVELDRDSMGLFLSELGAQASNSFIAVNAIVQGSGVFSSQVPEPAKSAGLAFIARALQDETARAKAEAQLLVAAMASRKRPMQPTNISISGDGNVVVAGDLNQVNTATSFDAGAADALAKALEASLRHLTSLPDGSIADAKEIKELFDQAIAEVQKPKPNKLTAMSLIKGIAETIKFVPAMKAAYDILQPVAVAHGIPI